MEKCIYEKRRGVTTYIKYRAMQLALCFFVFLGAAALTSAIPTVDGLIGGVPGVLNGAEYDGKSTLYFTQDVGPKEWIGMLYKTHDNVTDIWYFAFIYNPSIVNDLTYDNNKPLLTWRCKGGTCGAQPQSHTFGNLLGSDHLKCMLKDANNISVIDFKIDLIATLGTTTDVQKAISDTNNSIAQKETEIVRKELEINNTLVKNATDIRNKQAQLAAEIANINKSANESIAKKWAEIIKKLNETAIINASTSLTQAEKDAMILKKQTEIAHLLQDITNIENKRDTDIENKIAQRTAEMAAISAGYAADIAKKDAEIDKKEAEIAALEIKLADLVFQAANPQPFYGSGGNNCNPYSGSCDGGMLFGDPSMVLNYSTSMEWNMQNSNYLNKTQKSPDINDTLYAQTNGSTYQMIEGNYTWEYYMIYEFAVNGSVLGGKDLGVVNIHEVHNSPYKIYTGPLVPVVGYCGDGILQPELGEECESDSDVPECYCTGCKKSCP